MRASVSKEQYFEGAFEQLAEVGFTGLNINSMCKALGVTSGSFYHHFGSWQGFVDAFLVYWEQRQEKILREMSFGQTGAEEDLKSLRKLTLGLHHGAEAAIRAWAMNDDAVRAVQKRVDRARRKTLSKSIERLIGEKSTAKSIATAGAAMLIGYQQMVASGEQASLEQILDELNLLVRARLG